MLTLKAIEIAIVGCCFIAFHIVSVKSYTCM